jgi:hypothetical protein
VKYAPMNIFVVFRVSDPNKIKTALEAAFQNDFLDLGHNEWLVSFKGIAIELSNKLGVTDATNGVAITFGMAGYFGRAPTNIWDWIIAKAEASDG